MGNNRGPGGVCLEDRFLPEHRPRIVLIHESLMRDAYGQLWLTDRRDLPRWQSPVAAMLVTAALFTAAFASMTRFGEPFAGTTVVDERPRLVFFPPPPVEPAKPAERPRVKAAPPNAPVRRLEQPTHRDRSRGRPDVVAARECATRLLGRRQLRRRIPRRFQGRHADAPMLPRPHPRRRGQPPRAARRWRPPESQ